MKTKAIMAAMLIACSVNVADAQTMVVNLANGSKMEFKTSEVTNVEFKEAEKKDDKPDNPVTDDGQFANGHEYVDLGLPSGTLWATCNVGANSPEEYGDYYAWGETETKKNYDESTYKYYASSTETYTDEVDQDGFEGETHTISYRGYTKYVTQSSVGYKGFYDNKTELDPEEDVVRVIWGGDWRMPTSNDFGELKDNCTWEFKKLKGVEGYKVIGVNGKYIFLPAAGFRSETRHCDGGIYGSYYMSSSIIEKSSNVSFLYIYKNKFERTGSSTRFYGHSVRAVRRQ